MIKNELIIPKLWRSELRSVVFFISASILSVVMSHYMPRSIIRGALFKTGTYTVVLDLPLWWLLPFAIYILTAVRIYNVRYAVDARGVEARVGRLSLRQIITNVRYEDIRSIETDQTLIERALDVGTVEVNTAAGDGVEVLLEGVGAPFEVKEMLLRERDARNRLEAEFNMAKDEATA